MTPLIRAADKGQIAVVELLIAKGANVNECAVAIYDFLSNERGHCLLSLPHSISSPQAMSEEWFTPLFVAADKGHLAVVELLLAKGAHVNQGAVAIHDYLSNEQEHF
jgi:ankyrin repeat protein